MNRPLGKTGIEVSPIGLGCWQFSEGKGLGGFYWPALEPDAIEAIIRVSLAGGINWFDTAEAYGNGASEVALARGLKANGVGRGEVVVATKWMPMMRTARSIGATIEDRMRSLDPFGIDLHQIHAPGPTLATEAQKMAAMAELVHNHKIRSAGVSNYGASRLRRAHELLAEAGLPLASNQVRYSLLDRSIERNGVMQVAKELGISIIAYSPLAQGLLTGKFHDDPSLVTGPRRWMPAFRASGLARSKPVVDEVRAIAADRAVTPGQVALAWLLQFHGDTVLAIPGATKEKHAADNVGAMTLTLEPDELRRLDAVSAGR